MNDETLQITIKTTSPQEYKEWLMKAISFMLRAVAMIDAGDQEVNWGQHQVMMTQLMDALINTDV